MKTEHSSFRAWLLTRHVTDTMRGDFIYDAKRDGELPDVQTWNALQSYLIRCQACDEAIKAGRALWKEWEEKRSGA
jgi:hypothetical protein